jgi:LacI family transcriptional regulator, repressor for deo operon, udp, cdd, tsx, nupC, and nupG
MDTEKTESTMTVHLKDIAAYTGVSIKTVSNVVNGNYARVSSETRTAVLEAIKKLNYQPNVAARHLRKARVGVIAFALPDLSNPYFADIGNAITAAAAEHDYTVLLDYTSAARDKELLVVKGLRPHLVDGIILDSHALDVEDILPDEVRTPIVLLGERLFGAPFNHVLVDNVAAAHAATQHLLSLGRRRIAAIGTLDHCQSEAPWLRLEGYRQALEEAGQQVDPRMLGDGGSWHRVDGAEAMRHLLALDDPPDGVFCFNDLMALGAMSVLHARGLRIPEDIAVVGFDDIEDGRYAYPQLTTIAPDKEEIGRRAVSLLIEDIKEARTQPPQCIKVPFHLCVRQSTVGGRQVE